MRFERTRGDSGEEVRKRMERWNERVDRAQRMTRNRQLEN